MNNKKLNSKYYGSSLFPILSDVFRYFVIMITEIIVYIICQIIRLVTYEKGKRNVLTKRKAWRIRILTKFKLWFYRNFKWLAKYLELEGYLEEIHKRFEK